MEHAFGQERRQHPRIEVRHRIFGHLNSGSNILGQVLNASEGGVAITYIADSGSALRHATLDLFATGGVVYLSAVPVRVVCDVACPREVEFSSIPLRQMGMAFETLTDRQQQELKRFIRVNG